MESVNQLAEGIAAAVVAAKPAQEYCFLWIDWWSTCMTKAEWSGWTQAIGSIAALGLAAYLLRQQLQHAESLREAERRARSTDLAEEEVKTLQACVTAANGVIAALKSFHKKLTGERQPPRDPRTSKERMEGLQVVILLLMGKQLPAVALRPLLELHRELSYFLAALGSIEGQFVPLQHADQAQSAAKRITSVVGARAELRRLLPEERQNLSVVDAEGK